jgi:hypothetical protein
MKVTCLSSFGDRVISFYRSQEIDLNLIILNFCQKSKLVLLNQLDQIKPKTLFCDNITKVSQKSTKISYLKVKYKRTNV